MQRNSQKGFGVLHILLLLVLVGIIGGTGYYIYKTQQDSKKREDAAAAQSDQAKTADDAAEEKVVNEEESWFLFEASDKAYSVRIPDGWEGVALNDNVYIRDSAKLVFKQGTKAQIEILPEGGWDGASPFALYLPRQNYDQIVREGTAEGDITTASGLVAHKYKFVQVTDPEGIGYSKGDTVYNYYFDAPGKYIQVSHVFAEGGTDQTALVERLIKTIQVN